MNKSYHSLQITKQLMATRHIPTFILKGVDPNKVLADYQSGVFTRPIKSKSRFAINVKNPILAPTYGNTNSDPIYSFKDRNNCSVVFATTGHENYKVYTSTGGELPIGGRCDYCKQDFDHVAIGYPISEQEQTILTTDSTEHNKASYRVFYIFWTEGEFCDFECALGYIRHILSRPAEYRDTTLRDCERMLKKLYYLTHPNAKPLRPASDPRLLRSNRGSLTKEEWKNESHIYIRTDRVLMIPAKVEYIQQNFLNPSSSIDLIKEIGTVGYYPQ